MYESLQEPSEASKNHNECDRKTKQEETNKNDNKRTENNDNLKRFAQSAGPGCCFCCAVVFTVGVRSSLRP